MQTLVESSSAFDLLFIGDVAYFSDTVGALPDAIYRAQDTDGSGSIDDGETSIWKDGDGKSGVFIDNPRSLEFALPKLGDLNGDDMVDGADLGLLLGSWGSDDFLADLNGDGAVDGADLGLLLGAWD